MPQLGIICPVDLQRVSTKVCLACRSAETPRPKQGHWCQFSYEHLAGMADASGRKTAYISATMLGGCRRQARLKEIKDYYTFPLRTFPAWRGTLGHLATEAWPEPGCLYEHRFEMLVPGFDMPFTGQIDKINMVRKKISDFKTKADAKMPASPSDSHVAQLNVYRYLVKYGWPQKPFRATFPNGEEWEFPLGVAAGIEIEQLELIYWSMSGVATFSKDSGTEEIPLWPDAHVLEYIQDGMSEMLAEKLPDIPEDLNPFRHPLCTSWCPVKDDCIAASYSFNADSIAAMNEE